MRKAWANLAAFGVVFALAGCGRVDSGATYFPEMIRERAPKPATPDPAPDVTALLPTNLSFSPPKPSFAEWMTCVKASVNGATGRAIGMQTYLVNIDHGVISRRERVGDSHWCATERYEPL